MRVPLSGQGLYCLLFGRIAPLLGWAEILPGNPRYTFADAQQSPCDWERPVSHH